MDAAAATRMKAVSLTLAVMMAAPAPPPACADPVWSIRPEPGLVCMAPKTGSLIVSQPSAKAPPLAVAGAIVFVMQRHRPVNGYVEIERPNKQTGWIEQATLSPGPDNCVPMLMSNGLILTGGG